MSPPKADFAIKQRCVDTDFLTQVPEARLHRHSPPKGDHGVLSVVDVARLNGVAGKFLNTIFSAKKKKKVSLLLPEKRQRKPEEGDFFFSYFPFSQS